ncbi:tetratricopeptide repeat protein [Portibacter marinus]|uniref:tetratricopeptide repeat protein n=1 Tax=Portibacter marinus TaxID=2898660 RepID=UPI001F3983F1|nr:tetratricopeptide repeat protein [Portibacter marinus]
MWIKSIIQGRLEFGNAKSYEKVVKMFNYRTENYHKNDILFKEEEIFFEDGFYMDLKRFVGQVTQKSFKNTMDLLGYCAQFAISGSIDGWLTDTGTVLAHSHVEPKSDKAVVQYFQKGKKLVKSEGEQQEAIKHLTKAIEKYNRHAQAYERRAKVNFILKKYHDALRDYNKSIGIDDTNPAAYYGRGKVHMINENWKEAAADFDMATKKSIALQSIYWKARRLKADCHIKLKEYKKAAFDLKLFSNRSFEEDSPNLKWMSAVQFKYGKVLVELEEYEEAIKAFNASIAERSKLDEIPEKEKYFYRGLAKKKAGKNGSIKDIKMAKELGFDNAEKLAAQMA